MTSPMGSWQSSDSFILHAGGQPFAILAEASGNATIGLLDCLIRLQHPIFQLIMSNSPFPYRSKMTNVIVKMKI